MSKSDALIPDTCAWIDFFNARATPLSSRLERALLSDSVYTCGVVKYELVQGVKSPKEETNLLRALQAVTHLDLPELLWIKGGRLASSLRSRGNTIPFSDILIAVLALEHDLGVLTCDRHFEQVPGIRIVSE